jgi:transcriptional regulatory protein LevR
MHGLYTLAVRLLISMQSLDRLLASNVSQNIDKLLAQTSTLSQLAQIMTNAEHFEAACRELEKSLTTLR